MVNSANNPPVGKLVIIGLGLIGGSLAAAMKQRGGCVEVVGVVRRQETAVFALENGLVDRAVLTLSDIAPELGQGDLIFVSVPTLSVPEILSEIKQHVGPEVTVTDGASVKGSVVDAVQRNNDGNISSQFVPGHPIAGSEKSGVSSADPELYMNHRVILTPLKDTQVEHVHRVTTMWETVGAQVLFMSVDEHDAVLAATSHLPHVIAYSLVDTLANDAENENIFRYAAGGFRDFTRIASSDPRMWHDIMLTNRDAILHAVDMFQANLRHLRIAIESGDSEYLLQTFTRAKEARDQFTAVMCPSSSKSQP